MSAVVRVQVPPGTSFGTVMGRIRFWLEVNKIQQWTYRATDGHGIVFEFDFDRESEAHLFTAAFSDLGNMRMGEQARPMRGRFGARLCKNDSAGRPGARLIQTAHCIGIKDSSRRRP